MEIDARKATGFLTIAVQKDGKVWNGDGGSLSAHTLWMTEGEEILTFSCVVQIVREVLPSGTASLRLNVDATRVGNVARFFNHR